MVCDWEGECIGGHFEENQGTFFMVTGGEVIYPIEIDWIEELLVETTIAIFMDNCQENEALSDYYGYGAEVYDCSDWGRNWTAGFIDAGFVVSGEGGEFLMCSWEGDCSG